MSDTARVTQHFLIEAHDAPQSSAVVTQQYWIVAVSNEVVSGPPGPPAPVQARGGAVYMDSFLEYDGRHVGTSDGLFPGISLTISGGSTWAAGEALTVTASLGAFTSDDVGNVLIVHAEDGTAIRLTITGYTSSTVVTATPNVAIPVAVRGAVQSTWDKAVDHVGGVDHLEGEYVAVLGDDHVIGSPNNAAVTLRRVLNGVVDLGDSYAHVYVGLPYLADLETLDIETARGPSLKAQKIAVNAVGLMLLQSRALWVGAQPPTNDAADPLELLTEMPAKGSADYETLQTGFLEVNSRVKQWNDNGRVFVRSIDPVPATVLAAIPQGFLPASQ